jgi:hypothetical protein
MTTLSVDATLSFLPQPIETGRIKAQIKNNTHPIEGLKTFLIIVSALFFRFLK